MKKQRQASRWWPDHGPEVYDALLELCGALSTETLSAMLNDLDGWKGELSAMTRDAIDERIKGRTDKFIWSEGDINIIDE